MAWALPLFPACFLEVSSLVCRQQRVRAVASLLGVEVMVMDGQQPQLHSSQCVMATRLLGVGLLRTLWGVFSAFATD